MSNIIKIFTGGKLINQGSYGCGYKPAFACDDSRNISAFSKITSQSNGFKELQKQQIFDTIDPNFKFHLKIIDGCYFNIDKHQDTEFGDTKEELLKCIQIYDNFGNLKPEKKLIINIEDGGKDLKKYLQINYNNPTNFPDILSDDNEFANIISSFSNIMFGIAKLYSSNYGHFDIKNQNVVYDEIKNRFNLIDFGLSNNFIQVKPSPRYAYFPVDTFLMSFDFNNFNDLNLIETNTVLLDYIHIFNTQKKGIINFTFENYDQLDELDREIDNGNNVLLNIDFFKPLKVLLLKYPEDKAINKFKKLVYSYIDTFSTGILLGDILRTRLKRRLDLNLDVISDKKLDQKLFELVKKMVKPYYYQRIHPINAYREYLNILNEVFIEKQLYYEIKINNTFLFENEETLLFKNILKLLFDKFTDIDIEYRDVQYDNINKSNILLNYYTKEDDLTNYLSRIDLDIYLKIFGEFKIKKVNDDMSLKINNIYIYNNKYISDNLINYIKPFLLNNKEKISSLIELPLHDDELSKELSIINNNNEEIFRKLQTFILSGNMIILQITIYDNIYYNYFNENIIEEIKLLVNILNGDIKLKITTNQIFIEPLLHYQLQIMEDANFKSFDKIEFYFLSNT